MAISKDKKQQLVADLNEILSDAKMTVFAKYQGLTVKEMQELADYLVKQNSVELFADYANSHGLQRRNLMIRKSHNLLERYINSRIIYNMLNEQAWHQYLNQKDPVIDAALKVFEKKK